MTICNAWVSPKKALIAVDTNSTGPHGEKITSRKLLTIGDGMILTGAGPSPFFDILRAKYESADFYDFDSLIAATPDMAHAAFGEVLALPDPSIKVMLEDGIDVSLIVAGYSEKQKAMAAYEFIQLTWAGRGFTGGAFQYAIRPSLGHNGLDTPEAMQELMQRQIAWAKTHYPECHVGGKMILCELTKEKTAVTEYDLNARTPGETPGQYLQRLAHHSFFRERPLIPASLENMLPEYQYNDYTSELLKAMGRFVGQFPGLKKNSIASPIVLDNYVRQWTGGTGLYVMQMLDAGLRRAGVLENPVKPTETLADIPVIRAFVVRYPSADANSIVDFYQRYKDAQITMHTIQTLAKRGDSDSALKELKVADAMLKLDDLKKTLDRQNEFIHFLNAYPGETEAEKAKLPAMKRQLIDAVYGMMIKETRGGNDMLDMMEKIMKESQLKTKPKEQTPVDMAPPSIGTAAPSGIPLDRSDAGLPVGPPDPDTGRWKTENQSLYVKSDQAAHRASLADKAYDEAKKNNASDERLANLLAEKEKATNEWRAARDAWEKHFKTGEMPR